MIRRLALRVFGKLPRRARRLIVRTFSPSYTVGAMCFVQRADGAVLFVRHVYRDRWGVPGGLAERLEDIHDTARREAREEIGVDVELLGPPAVVVAADAQRVDVIFRARIADAADEDRVRATSAEIAEVRWFGAAELPEMQMETATALDTLRRRSGEGDASLPEPNWPDLGGGA